VPRPDGGDFPPDHLRVLPRHRLLLDAHGFEGLVVVKEVLRPGDLAVADRVDAGDVRSQCDAASGSLSAPVAPMNHAAVVNREQLADSMPRRGPGRPALVNEGPPLLATV